MNLSFKVLHVFETAPVYLLTLHVIVCVCCVVEVTLLLLQYRAMAAAAGRQAGNDEVIQQAGLRP